MTDNNAAQEDAGYIECRADEGFREFLSKAGGSVAISTYQAERVLFAHLEGNRCDVVIRHVGKAMGIDTFEDTLAIATTNGITAYTNASYFAKQYYGGKRDALFLPRLSWHFPDIGVHDIAFGNQGVYMALSHFSCIALTSLHDTFVPVWQPKFISDLAPEDRCHLNGIAMRNGEPAFATALGETDTPSGWRENKASGGVLLDVESDEILCRGLAMPHSPRWHQNQLFMLNSGAGELLRIDPATGKSDVVCRLPAYLRGLSFVGNMALVGMCKIRESNVFGGMPVQEEYDELLCGVALVDLSTGNPVGSLTVTNGCTEVYDIRFLSGLRAPDLAAEDSPESRRAITSPEKAFWMELPEDRQSRESAG